MPRGRKPSQAPCPTCGKNPISDTRLYFKCDCGRFVLKNGELHPVRAKRVAPRCPKCGKGLYQRRQGYFRCETGCNSTFNLVEGEWVEVTRTRAEPGEREAMDWREYERMNGWSG